MASFAIVTINGTKTEDQAKGEDRFYVWKQVKMA